MNIVYTQYIDSWQKYMYVVASMNILCLQVKNTSDCLCDNLQHAKSRYSKGVNVAKIV